MNLVATTDNNRCRFAVSLMSLCCRVHFQLLDLFGRLVEWTLFMCAILGTNNIENTQFVTFACLLAKPITFILTFISWTVNCQILSRSRSRFYLVNCSERNRELVTMLQQLQLTKNRVHIYQFGTCFDDITLVGEIASRLFFSPMFAILKVRRTHTSDIYKHRSLRVLEPSQL